MPQKDLYELIDMESPDAVLSEVITILQMLYPHAQLHRIRSAFQKTSDLYHGKYAGYRACTTRYHDYRHIYETFLAMTRLVHGAVLGGISLQIDAVLVGLIAALLHDAGYIQETSDSVGTGGKHTVIHVRRSIDFVENNASAFTIEPHEVQACQVMIYCTDLAADFDSIVYPSYETEVLAKILATADLLAQMADRTHLEKLLYLYQEFREGMVTDYDSTEVLLRETIGFYDLVRERFEKKLGGIDRYMVLHFKARWGIDADLYQIAIENERKYLYDIIKGADTELLEHLRRKGITGSTKTSMSS